MNPHYVIFEEEDPPVEAPTQTRRVEPKKWTNIRPRITSPPSFLARVPYQMVMLSILAVLSFCISATSANVSENCFVQRVDHGDAQNNQTFCQRYFAQDAFWRPQEKAHPMVILVPAFFASATDMQDSTYTYWAEAVGAYLFQLESRYAGKSFPERSTAALRYNSVDQHVEDLLRFISSKSLELNVTNDRWIIVGSYFEGAYSTWFRSKYPSLAFGSISVSPYLVATLENQGYDAVYQDIVGPACASAVHDVVGNISSWLNQLGFNATEAYRASIGCDSSSVSSQGDFFYVMSQLIFGSTSDPKFCSNFTEMQRLPSEQQRAKFAETMKVLLEGSFFPCGLRNIAKNNGSQSFRSIYYLQCTQLGQFQTPGGQYPMTPPDVNLSWYLGVCNSIFSNTLPKRPDVALFNDAYGGSNPNGCNMVFITSPNDIYRSIGPDAAAITRASRTNKVLSVDCPDPSASLQVLFAPSDNDPPCIKNMRIQIREILQQWQQDAEACPVPRSGGDGDDDDETIPAIVGTVVGVFGILIGIIIGGALVWFFSRNFIRRAKRYAFSKLL